MQIAVVNALRHVNVGIPPAALHRGRGSIRRSPSHQLLGCFLALELPGMPANQAHFIFFYKFRL
jgi:hypothetical protein